MTSLTVGRCITIGAAALLLIQCGTTPGQFVIIQNQVPTAGCVIPADKGAIYRGTGEMDVRLVRDQAEVGYIIFPLLQNNLPAPAGGQTIDSNRIALSSFKVDVRLPADAPADDITNLFNNQLMTSAPDGSGGPDPLIHFSVPTSGSVASGGGNTASGVVAVPAQLARRIRDTRVLETTPYVYLMASIRAHGGTLNGGLDSDAFDYPIRVCDGCLIASRDICPVAQKPANPGNDCNVAQDALVDCCLAGSGLVCPSLVSSQ
jgi:hypothetical protein